MAEKVTKSVSNRRVRRQIEAILDTSESREPVSLIVQARDPGPQTLSVLRSAYAGIRGRAMNVSPPECLPPPKNELLSDFQRAPKDGPAGGMSLAVEISHASPIEISPIGYIERESNAIRQQLDQLKKDVVLRATSVFASASSFGAVVDRDVLAGHRTIFERFPGVFPDLRVPAPRKSRSARPYKENEVLKKGAAWGIDASRAMNAWGAFDEMHAGAKGEDILVAVLDTGIDASHPDLVDKVCAWADFDLDGRELRDSDPYDSVGHGTHVAGTIVGGNASGNHIGMAPKASILAARVIDGDGGGTMMRLLAGFDWALRSGADVINMSLGSTTFDHFMDDQWDGMNPWEIALARALRAGVPTVAAIGNNGHQSTCLPANHILAFAVGAHASDNRCASFSGGTSLTMHKSSLLESDALPINYNKPDLSAPGVDIKSCLPCEDGEPKWGILHGTSMAAPHVSGAIAQLLSATRIKSLPAPLRAPVIADILKGSCVDLGEIGLDQRFGFGRLDVYSAISAAHERGY